MTTYHKGKRRDKEKRKEIIIDKRHLREAEAKAEKMAETGNNEGDSEKWGGDKGHKKSVRGK